MTSNGKISEVQSLKLSFNDALTALSSILQYSKNISVDLVDVFQEIHQQQEDLQVSRLLLDR